MGGWVAGGGGVVTTDQQQRARRRGSLPQLLVRTCNRRQSPCTHLCLALMIRAGEEEEESLIWSLLLLVCFLGSFSA